MRWLITVPAWGERYRQNFLKAGLPSILASLAEANITDFRFLIHTDKPEDFDCLSSRENVSHRCLPVPDGYNGPSQLGNSHRIAWKMAEIGECIAFCNADMTFSIESFGAAERRFGEGKRMINCHSLRTKDIPGPIGWDAKALLGWAWDHRHRWVDDCIYEQGHVAGPAIVVFEHAAGGTVVVHCFSLQPFAIFKDCEREFIEPTADEMVSCFPREEVYVVQSNTEMAIAEATPDDIWYGTNDAILDRSIIIGFAPGYTTPAMCWQFAHQIIIKGKPLPYGQYIVDDTLSKIDQARRPSRLFEHDQRMSDAQASA